MSSDKTRNRFQAEILRQAHLREGFANRDREVATRIAARLSVENHDLAAENARLRAEEAGSVECPSCAADIRMTMEGAHSGCTLVCAECGGRAVLDVAGAKARAEFYRIYEIGRQAGKSEGTLSFAEACAAMLGGAVCRDGCRDLRIAPDLVEERPEPHLQERLSGSDEWWVLSPVYGDMLTARYELVEA